MANSKISALTSATTVAGTEVLPIVQSSATVKVSVANLTPGLGTITAAKGGTGQTSYAVGDLLYADTTTTLAKLADVATGNALISGGVSTAPSWGKIGLTTHVSGTLPTANGGTNLTSFTANGVMYASSTSALATGTALTFDGNQLSVLRASTSTALFDDAEIRAINTGTATINQRVDIAMRWQDGTYNGTGGIGMVRESSTARSGTLTFYPINSSGDALAAMRLSSAGDATVTTGNVVIGTSGKGIDFSATAGTGTSELLADYEEGTWTAAFVTSGGSITISPSYNTGGYTKVGRLVTVNLHARFSSVSSPTGDLSITGLPFTSNSSIQCRNSGAVAAVAITSLATPMTAYVNNNATQITLTGFVAATGGYAAAGTYINASSELYLTVSYYV
jgi:hypothetical protein